MNGLNVSQINPNYDFTALANNCSGSVRITNSTRNTSGIYMCKVESKDNNEIAVHYAQRNVLFASNSQLMALQYGVDASGHWLNCSYNVANDDMLAAIKMSKEGQTFYTFNNIGKRLQHNHLIIVFSH